jgi:cytochrome c peroxidase
MILPIVVAQTAAPRPVLVPPYVPELRDSGGIITSKRAAIALGKALFWDQQAGSDGVACASCHFAAGADIRLRNQLNPGFADAGFAPTGDTEFGSDRSDTGEVLAGRMPSGNPAGPNYALVREDFPLHQLKDYADRNSDLITTTNDTVSSSGAYSTDFTRVKGLGLGVKDKCSPPDGTLFHAGGLPARQTAARNTPTTINAAFYHSNFWDGRANNLFNGVGVFGMRDILEDPNKRLIVLDSTGEPGLGYLEIRNASLASQAVGPPLSDLEMSCSGRTFPDLGRRLLQAIPLFGQEVHPQDGVLGAYASPSGKGLKPKHGYAELIRQAFDPKYWAAPGRYRIANGQLQPDPLGYTQMETNFSMFWGLSIMLYEETLISDQSRFDAWFASCRPRVTAGAPAPPGTSGPVGNPTVTCTTGDADPTKHGLTAPEVLGFALFNVPGNPRVPGHPACATCHGPVANVTNQNNPIVLPVFSEAAFTSGQTGPYNPVERAYILENGDDNPPSPPTSPQGGVHTRGFFNIGVTPATADLGNGGTDPYGNPLADARAFLVEQSGGAPIDPPRLIRPATPANPVTATEPLNRCTSPGMIEPGGTPPFPGCLPTDPTPPGVLNADKERELVDGTFKTPSLRNVGLTPPYFHSGNYSDLRSVMEFYARGGSRRARSKEDAASRGDTSGTGPLGKGAPVGGDFGTNVDFFMRDIKSTPEQIDALVAFMLTLTDRRVQCDAAPFDHPSLTLLHGHTAVDAKPKDGRADDVKATLPAVGASGYAVSSGYCLPNGGDLFAPGMQGRVGGKKVPLD